MASGRHWCRRVLAPGLTGGVLLGCALGPGPSAPVVAHLTADSPGINVRRAGQLVPYSAGMPLHRGDGVRTRSGTSATVEFTDGNVVYLRDDTSVEVGTIRLFFGEIFNLVRSLAGGGSTVFTNDLAAAAEGTMFLVKADASRGTTVTVVEGTVRVSPSRGARWTMVPVHQDQQLTATTRTRSSPTAIDARVTGQWVNDSARRLDRPIVIGPRTIRTPGTQPPVIQPQRRPPPVIQ